MDLFKEKLPIISNCSHRYIQTVSFGNNKCQIFKNEIIDGDENKSLIEMLQNIEKTILSNQKIDNGSQNIPRKMGGYYSYTKKFLDPKNIVIGWLREPFIIDNKWICECTFIIKSDSKI